MSDSVWPHRRQSTRLPHPWDSPGENTGVGCHFLLHCCQLAGGKAESKPRSAREQSPAIYMIPQKLLLRDVWITWTWGVGLCTSQRIKDSQPTRARPVSNSDHWDPSLPFALLLPFLPPVPLLVAETPKRGVGSFGWVWRCSRRLRLCKPNQGTRAVTSVPQGHVEHVPRVLDVDS